MAGTWKPSQGTCGARRKKDGKPCKMMAMHNGRCYWHGGLSTGPKSIEGKVNAWRNLPQYSDWSTDELKAHIAKHGQR